MYNGWWSDMTVIHHFLELTANCFTSFILISFYIPLQANVQDVQGMLANQTLCGADKPGLTDCCSQ